MESEQNNSSMILKLFITKKNTLNSVYAYATSIAKIAFKVGIENHFKIKKMYF